MDVGDRQGHLRHHLQGQVEALRQDQGRQKDPEEKNQIPPDLHQRNRNPQKTRPSQHPQNLRDLRGLRLLLHRHRVTVSLSSICEGGDLFDRLSSHPFSEVDVQSIFKQLLYALNYCHREKIAHRDLKLENFLLASSEGYDVKIIDFGEAFSWKNSMKEELSQLSQSKLVGTVTMRLLSATTWHPKSSKASTTKTATSGHWGWCCTSSSPPCRPSTGKQTKTSSRRSRRASTPAMVSSP